MLSMFIGINLKSTHMHCKNTVGSFICHCDIGWEVEHKAVGSVAGSKTCQDIDECKARCSNMKITTLRFNFEKSPREHLLSNRSGGTFQNCTNVRTNFRTSKSFILTVAIKVLIVPTHKDHITVHVNQDIMEMERLALKMMHVLAIDVVQWDCVLTF